MAPKHLILAVLLVIVLAAAVYVLGVRPADHTAVPALSGAPPIAGPQGTAQEAAPHSEMKITGDYAGDWQAKCGPITDAKAQGQCTQALDEAYGRKADTPIPAVPAPATTPQTGGR